MKNLFLFTYFLLFSWYVMAQNPGVQLSAPAGNRYCVIDPAGETIIPNGRIIRPLGKTVRIAPHPYGLTMSPDGNTVITANSGTNPFSISILQNIFSDNPVIHQIPEGTKTDEDLLSAVFMGLAVSPDNQTVYVAGGQTNKVFLFNLKTRKKTGTIDCNKTFNNTDYKDGYLGDMVLSRDGKTLYAVDQIGFRMLVIDTQKKQVITNVPTGRYPFGIALSPDEKTVYVANVGMFQYSYIKGVDRKRIKETAMKKPAFGYNTPAMRNGIQSDSLTVPGLGDPNVPESFSVWAIDVASRKVTARVKTGVLVGEKIDGIPAVGGSSPNSIVATNRYVFVSNGNNDLISVIDPKTQKILQQIDLQLDPRLGKLKGIIPFGLALSPDQKRLYVAESGINAVGVIDIPTMKVIGHLPVGWFPSKLKVSPDGKKLVVANAKGYGSGPNGGANYKPGPEGSYIGSLMKGSVTILDIPTDDQLKAETRKVFAYNFSPPALKGESPTPDPSPVGRGVFAPPMGVGGLRHVVFISKENRTYDEIFGQVKKGKGDPTLARFGIISSPPTPKGESPTPDPDPVGRGVLSPPSGVGGLAVMPNHLALASRFGIADNFYVDADHSADGHRWLANVYPNEWLETHTSAAYGGKRDFKADSKAPGIFAMTGASGSFYPEDYNQHGSMWEHMERHKVSFFNFGFTTEQEAGSYNDSTLKYGGEVYTVNYPTPAPMYNKTSWRFPTYNMAIPDQFRADVFMQEFNQRFIGEGKTMPQVVTLMLPNDHGAGERPQAGYPFRESYMADNDLAVGRVVEFLSRMPYWKNMVIIVTEDDSQGGVDHVDAHRSILAVYSPYAKKDYVSHVHYSFGSIFKTIWQILGVPYLNQYDAGATDLSDFFTDQPDFTPYNAVPVDARIFDPQKALTPLNEKFDWKALKESPGLDDEKYLIKTRKEEDQKVLEERDLQANPRIRRKKKKQ